MIEDSFKQLQHLFSVQHVPETPLFAYIFIYIYIPHLMNSKLLKSKFHGNRDLND